LSALIETAHIRKLLNSRGEETVEVVIQTESSIGAAIAPSGASRGFHEALYLPKNGIDEAIRRFRNEVAPELIGMDALDQCAIDSLLSEIDGSNNFSKLGGAVAIATSMANLWAAANALGIPLYRYIGGLNAKRLPLPLGNIIGGGKHALWRSIHFQEVLVVPLNPSDYREAIKLVVDVHRKVAKILSKRDPHFAGGKNDEGAWVTRLGLKGALDVVKDAIRGVLEQYDSEVKMGIGIDVAASSFWNQNDGTYRYEGKIMEPAKHYDFISQLIEEYQLVYIEDPFHEEDFDSFSQLAREYRDILVVGDDLFVTNVKRIRIGIERRAANAVVIKPNQVGTITGTLEAVRLARDHMYKIIVSHRSGETNDFTIAHLAVGLDAPIIKTGVMGGERIAKHNELLRIEEELDASASIWNLSFK